MSVDAILQLSDAEKQAEELMNKARKKIQLEEEESEKRIAQFKAEQLDQEESQKKALRRKNEEEWQHIKAPIVEDTKKQINQLQNISPEIRKKAQNLIINKVVNEHGN
ncbi:MAG TPA: hypothetical protein VK118_03810 [Tetragenococcus sp.]|nr:hypothetical protein [Tetragenococcus sp.]